MKKILLVISFVIFSLIGCSFEKENKSESTALYYCPMHPEVTSDKPSVCPICQMDLVKKGSDESTHFDKEGIINLGERKQLLASVETYTVKKEHIHKEIESYSYVDFAEPLKKTLSARFNGRIEKLYASETGKIVNKGEPLFEIYSPELVQAQNEYLIALNKNNSDKIISNSSEKESPNNLLNSAKQKLHLLGLTEEQINEIEKNGKPSLQIKYLSPFQGTIIEKRIQEGMYVNEGTILFEIADISKVWVISEIFENDIQFIKKGVRTEFHSDNFPGKSFIGNITFISPVIDKFNRTIKVRSELQNSGNQLLPNMYGLAKFNLQIGEGLTVPENAVVDYGRNKIVWVKVEENIFEPRNVALGVKFGGKFQVLSGINEGDEIVTQGSYLIDSESQLKFGNNAKAFDTKKDITKKIFNSVCPVQGDEVDPEVPAVEYKGKIYGFCCSGCDKKFAANPEKYLKNLSSDGKKFIEH